MIGRAPFTMALTRLREMPRSLASLVMLIRIGFMNSSRRISPGWIDERSFLALINSLSDSRLFRLQTRHRFSKRNKSANVHLCECYVVLFGRPSKLQACFPAVRLSPAASRPVEVQQLPSRNPFKCSISLNVNFRKQCLRLFGPEVLNHHQQFIRL